MKVAFFVSSVGDTDLALKTITSMENKAEVETCLIALTQTAEQRITSSRVQCSSLALKTRLSDILDVQNFSEAYCTREQLDVLTQYIKNENITYIYLGVPSTNNKIPLQVAAIIEDIPVLMAYEFMFKPEGHDLWDYLPVLKSKQNIQWALPLIDAVADFDFHDMNKVKVTGHLSIDNAYSSNAISNSDIIREHLHILPNKKFAFVSSTTQPILTDTIFLESLLALLPNHPDIQVRFGLHPGIQDLDAYVREVLTVCQRYPSACDQFKIILPDNLLGRFKYPALSIEHPATLDIFLRVNVTGPDASFAADRVAQSVPGALLNQAVIEGKPSYAHGGKSYLPKQHFSNDITAFFSANAQAPRSKEELGLNDKTAPQNYADMITGPG
ncbi:MAG: hypothetical protein P1U61_08120 [Legionellaceae bacterium]|nr:hypothetical protein [Legionellaceae bacterium]